MRAWKHLFLGFVVAASVGSFANVPKGGSGSMAIEPEVSEIQAKRQQDLRTDADFKRLSQAQGRYRENLPLTPKKAPARKAVARKSGTSIRTSQAAAVRAPKTPAKKPVAQKKISKKMAKGRT